MSDRGLATTHGEILRIVDDTLAYVILANTHTVLPVVPSALTNYRGEKFKERKIYEGSAVELVWRPNMGTVESLKALSRPRRRSERLLSFNNQPCCHYLENTLQTPRRG